MTFSRPASSTINALFQPSRPQGPQPVQEMQVTLGRAGRFEDYTSPEIAGANAGQDMRAISQFFSEALKVGQPVYKQYVQGQGQAQASKFLATVDVAGLYRAGDRDQRNMLNALNPFAQLIVAEAFTKDSARQYLEIYQAKFNDNALLRSASSTPEQLAAERARIDQEAREESGLSRAPAGALGLVLPSIAEGRGEVDGKAVKARLEDRRRSDDSVLASDVKTGWLAAAAYARAVKAGVIQPSPAAAAPAEGEQPPAEGEQEAGVPPAPEPNPAPARRGDPALPIAEPGSLGDGTGDPAAAPDAQPAAAPPQAAQTAAGEAASVEAVQRRYQAAVVAGLRTPSEFLQIEQQGLSRAYEELLRAGDSTGASQLLRLARSAYEQSGITTPAGPLLDVAIGENGATLGSWLDRAESTLAPKNDLATLGRLEGLMLKAQGGDQDAYNQADAMIEQIERENPALMPQVYELRNRYKPGEDLNPSEERIQEEDTLLGRIADLSIPDETVEAEIKASDLPLRTKQALRERLRARREPESTTRLTQGSIETLRPRISATAIDIAQRQAAATAAAGRPFSEEEAKNLAATNNARIVAELDAAVRKRIETDFTSKGRNPSQPEIDEIAYNELKFIEKKWQAEAKNFKLPDTNNFQKDLTGALSLFQSNIVKARGEITVASFPPFIIELAKKRGIPLKRDNLINFAANLMKGLKDPDGGATFPDPRGQIRRWVDESKRGGGQPRNPSPYGGNAPGTGGGNTGRGLYQGAQSSAQPAQAAQPPGVPGVTAPGPATAIAEALAAGADAVGSIANAALTPPAAAGTMPEGPVQLAEGDQPQQGPEVVSDTPDLAGMAGLGARPGDQIALAGQAAAPAPEAAQLQGAPMGGIPGMEDGALMAQGRPAAAAGRAPAVAIAGAANRSVGMSSANGPEAGNKACVWAVNQVLKRAGVAVPWGSALSVPEARRVLAAGKGRLLSGPQPGAIVIFRDNGNPPYPHMGVVMADGKTLISNSSSRASFSWTGTEASYTSFYGKKPEYWAIGGAAAAPSAVPRAAGAAAAAGGLQLRAGGLWSEGGGGGLQLRAGGLWSEGGSRAPRSSPAAARGGGGAARPVPLAMTNDKHLYFIGIGLSEGTRTADGGYTKAYYNHAAPEDRTGRKRNVGTVSSADYTDPRKADQVWIQKLNRFAVPVDAKLRSLGLKPNQAMYQRLMFNALDLHVQSPLASEDFVKMFGRIVREGGGDAAILRARVQSYVNPATGRLEAGGFDNSRSRLEADQRRRVNSFNQIRRM